MAIEKSVYAAPMGLADLAQEPDIEIEIEDPEEVTIRAGGLEIEIGKGGGEGIDDFTANLAEHMDDSALGVLADELVGDFTQDKDSRKDWEKTYKDGLKLLGLKIEDRTEPWPGACGVFHPLLSEAVVRFQADAIMETFPASGPVKTQIIGKLTREKEQASIRVKDDMNYKLTVGMSEYRAEHERMLWSLALAGSAFKKVYFDPNLDRQVSVFVPAEDFIISHGASDLRTCGRYTHVMRKTANDVKKLQVARFYRDVELPDPDQMPTDFSELDPEDDASTIIQDDRYLILEMHVDLDIEDDPYRDEDGIAIPYVVTIEKSSNTILSIRRNWNPDDKLRLKRMHFVHYIYIPGFGFYGYGLIHLIGGHAKSSTSLLRQLVDAGTLSNLPGGLKTRGLRIKGDDTPIAPGEFRDVDVASGSIAENITFLPYKEPSQTLLALMDNIVGQGRALAAVAELKIQDVNKETPVGTTLALLERSLKVMSAVQARIHAAMKTEFGLLKEIIAEFAPEEYEYEPDGAFDGLVAATRADYDIVEVVPVSDPNASTFSQRVIQYQAALQLANTAPQLYDMGQLHRQMLETLGMRNVQKILPLDEDKKPVDPVSENMNILNMKPVKAFIYQDHEAHLKVHQSMAQDPVLAQALGQNPQAQTMVAALQAHIAEHLAFQYRQKIETVMGAPLPPPDAELPETMEIEMSRVAAQAAQIVTGMSRQQVAAQQAQQAQQDPVVQMQQQELQLKAAEVQRKAQKDQMDGQLRFAQIETERMRIEQQAEIDGARLGAQIAKDQTQQEFQESVEAVKQEIEGTRMGMELGRSMEQAQVPQQTQQPKGE
jgi:hypothetical protein